VAYVRTRADVQADGWIDELCVVDRSTGQRHELGSGSQPRWAPDGRSLAFACVQGTLQAIVRWHAGSGERQTLTTLAKAPSGLAWSPEGCRLAFVVQVPAPAAATPNPTPDWERLRTPQWAAPGVYTEQLVRRAEGLPGDLPAGQHHIFVLDIASGALRQLTEGPHDHGGPRTWITKLALAGTSRGPPMAVTSSCRCRAAQLKRALTTRWRCCSPTSASSTCLMAQCGN